jgi:hypothetical protein
MSINKELGFPVNRFLVMARAAIRGLVVSEGIFLYTLIKFIF